MMQRSSSILCAVVLASVLILAAAPTPAVAAPARPTPVELSSRATSGYTCAWPIIADVDTLNVDLPETNATYWMQDYYLEAGRKLVIRGIYPFARFFEFTTYAGGNPILPDDPDGPPGGTLVDEYIQPQPGSMNPFSTPKASDRISERHYRVVITAHADSSSTNVLSGLPDGVDSGWGQVIYRLYLPDSPQQLKGGVGLPKLTDVSPSGKTKVPPCKETQAPPASTGNTVAVPAGLGGPSRCVPDLTFCLPNTAASLYPNPANKYILAESVFAPGRVVVLTGKVPTFPDTRAGQSVTTASDMRYWSICQNLATGTYPVAACKADYQIPLTSDRSYTIVISAREDRPGNATTAYGVAWLPWGDTTYDGVIVLRNMLPATAFCCSIQNVDPLDTPPYAVMGPYYPHAKYCTTAGFEADAAACVPQP